MPEDDQVELARIAKMSIMLYAAGKVGGLEATSERTGANSEQRVPRNGERRHA